MSTAETPGMQAVRYNKALSRAQNNLVTALPINEMIPHLISHQVLTGNLAEHMRAIAIASEKTAFLLRSIKQNLDDGRIDQFEHFVQALQEYAEDEDDILAKRLLCDLKGKNDPGSKNSSVLPHNEPAAVELRSSPNYGPPNSGQLPASYPAPYNAPMATYGTISPVAPVSYNSGMPPGMPPFPRPAPAEPMAPYNTGLPGGYNNYPPLVASNNYPVMPPVLPYGGSAPTMPVSAYRNPVPYIGSPTNYMTSQPQRVPSAPYTYYPNQCGSQNGDYSRRDFIPPNYPNQYNPPDNYQLNRSGSMPPATYNNYPTQYAPPQATPPYQPGGYDGRGMVPMTTGTPTVMAPSRTSQVRIGNTKVSESAAHHQLVDAYQKAITRHYQQLVTLLPIEDMMEDLMKGKIISHSHQVSIDSKPSRAEKTQIILDKLCHSLSSGILEPTENFLIVIENYGKRESDTAIVRLAKDVRGDAHTQGVKSRNFTSHYDAVSCRVALEKSRSELIASLPMNKLLPDLYAHEVVSMHLKDELMAMSSPQQQAKIVVNSLQTALSVGVTSGFERFLHAIQEYARREHDYNISQLVELIFNDIKQE